MSTIPVRVQATLRQGIQDVGLKAVTYNFRGHRPGADWYQNVHEFTARWETPVLPIITTEFFIAEKQNVLSIVDVKIANKHRGGVYERSLVERLEGVAKDLAIPHVEAHGDIREIPQQQFWRNEGYTLQVDGSYGGIWVMGKTLQTTPQTRPPMTFGHPIPQKNGATLNRGL